jgi:hypothetical protein
MTKIGAGVNLIKIPIKFLEDFTVLGFRSKCVVKPS